MRSEKLPEHGGEDKGKLKGKNCENGVLKLIMYGAVFVGMTFEHHHVLAPGTSN